MRAVVIGVLLTMAAGLVLDPAPELPPDLRIIAAVLVAVLAVALGSLPRLFRR